LTSVFVAAILAATQASAEPETVEYYFRHLDRVEMNVSQ